MKLLCKFPTRGRPQRFLTTLRGWIENATHPENVTFIVSYDHDDATMTPAVIAQTQGLRCEVRCYAGNSRTKIEAVNADIYRMMGWDAVLVVSDDMFCRRKGWDELIEKKMNEFHPDGDGALWFHDGTKQRVICTLSCMTWKMYSRLGNIYHASYKSFWCDNEFTDVARGLGKLPFIEDVVASHEHPSWNAGMKPDSTYQRNHRYWAEDKQNYELRKAQWFPL